MGRGGGGGGGGGVGVGGGGGPPEKKNWGLWGLGGKDD
jgi:hypothetical protein